MNEDYFRFSVVDILFIFTEVNYADPVGPLPTRPMTAAGKRDDDFGDEELGDDLLPV